MTYIYDPEEMNPRELAPGVNLRTMSGEKMMLSVVNIDADAVMPPHAHPHEQAGMVLEGEFEFTIGGDTQTVKKGDVYIIPGGVEHSLRANGEPSLALDIFSPPREDYM
ncbi:MAG: cupin domain-containing protein [SAR202 cluster bacterium]|jgi:quercetin dioxygenase-like cupin family protein|nr:cupin domain-containing protein [SAR202 cluster bacterium]MDP7103336.1 cupin domain-containing protein [SAR202 cluster bacterium]MDP7224748.1 cupin domain-containing protein [SAR202 cluster bacterium]MDP7412779.1 cupin domain-containing protein [SAR202 cluster bacterium]|tara:strand:- start:948 stop:1274 length:327 start_codon:yes stop_codon:yes gene_type:complete